MVTEHLDCVHTAVHEASHAVIARVLTLYCDGSTIEPDHEAMEAGHSICHHPYACIYQWRKRGKARDLDAVWHARIIAVMAGAEGEGVLLGSTPGGDDEDRVQIALMAEELFTDDDFWDKTEPRLRAMTRMLVRRHRVLIDRVTRALLRRVTLTGAGVTLTTGAATVTTVWASLANSISCALAAALGSPELGAAGAGLAACIARSCDCVAFICC